VTKVRGVPDAAATALELATTAGHTAMLGELAVYLRRAGCPVTVPTGVPQPWADGLAGRWRAAAQGRDRLGDRYEWAVELAGADDADARAQGLRVLAELGARRSRPADRRAGNRLSRGVPADGSADAACSGGTGRLTSSRGEGIRSPVDADPRHPWDGRHPQPRRIGRGRRR
jgi:hypothetical protein